MSNIGLMEGAFFVGRKEIVDWINSTLEINISKVEETATGAIACQLLDIMYPGEVPMHKVNWGAKQNFEIVANYKILQTCFTKLKIDKHIDVDRLISGKYMDNLEFMQWFKRFFELGCNDKGDYNCQVQRQKGKASETVPSATGKKPSASAPAASKSSVPTKTLKSSSARELHGGSTTKESGNASPKKLAPSASHKPTSTTTTKENQVPTHNKKTSASTSNATSPKNQLDVTKYEKEIDTLKQTIESQSQTEADLRTELEGTEKERDFYFEKLRDIETMLQEVEDKGEGTELTARIFKILYATADGFEAVANDTEGDVDVGENIKSNDPDTYNLEKNSISEHLIVNENNDNVNESFASENTQPLPDETF